VTCGCNKIPNNPKSELLIINQTLSRPQTRNFYTYIFINPEYTTALYGSQLSLPSKGRGNQNFFLFEPIKPCIYNGHTTAIHEQIHSMKETRKVFFFKSFSFAVYLKTWQGRELMSAELCSVLSGCASVQEFCRVQRSKSFQTCRGRKKHIDKIYKQRTEMP